jgi:hydrophobic/amphiphilic exporter-1 (mainly G- bacteria), HAE1 family
MSLPQISIRNPVMAVMLSLFFVLVGAISFVYISIQETPDITYPVITINTMLPGGSPTIVNQTLTKPIEEQVNTIAGIQQISSQSTPGKSEVELTFKLGTNMNVTYNRIQSKLNQIRNSMPSDARQPIITEAKSNASPIIFLSLHGSSSLLTMDQYARNVIEKTLENISGVGKVQVVGVSKEAVSIDLNLQKLAQMKITPGQVQQAFKSQQVNIPGGNIKSGAKQFSLELDLSYHQINKLKDLIVVYRDGAPVLLKDVAKVSFGLANNESVAYYNGQPSVGITVTKRSGANTVNIADEVEKRLNSTIIPGLPNNMKLTTVYNQATYIKQSIHQLEQDIWISILAAAVIILLFLKSLRSTIIIACAIPVSLFAAIGVAYAFGFTLNTVTMLAMIILVGVVVDDSIVVLENIFRHVNKKKDGDRKAYLKAAEDGSNQVCFAVLASSITLVCIFLPVVFVGGTISLLFKSFGVVVTGGVIISLIVALTLTPTLCSRFMVPQKTYRGFYKFLEKCFVGIDVFYKWVLSLALRFRWIVVVIALVFIAAAVPATIFINKGFMPQEQGTGYFTITVQPPQGLSVNYTETRVKLLENLLQHTSGISHYFSSMGPGNLATVSVKLSSSGTGRQSGIMGNLRQETKKLPGALYFVQQPNNASSMTFQVRGPNYDKVMDTSFKLLNELQKYQKQLGDTYIDFSPSQPAFKVNINRTLANSLGITPGAVADTLTFLGSEGVRIGHFSKTSDSERYDVLMRVGKGEFTEPKDINRLYMQGKKGTLVRLDTIANMVISLSPSKITRTDLQYSIGFSTLPKISTNKAITLVDGIAAKMLPKGYTLHLTGNTASLGKTERSVLVTLIIILILIYMVLASQFNSFIQPLLVMVAQPLALLGGVLILWIVQQTLNVYSMIGMLLLVGLVSKNSILLIDLTNQLRKKGMSIKDALSSACPTRMRPVIMTSLTIIIAMLPTAIITGPGSSTYQPLAWVIIGGMFVSTILTLVVVPSLYSLVENGLEKRRGKPTEEVAKTS